MHPPSSSSTGQSKTAAVFHVTAGNFLEQFDFLLFGFYTTQITNVFFSAESEFALLMMTFVVSGVGLLTRPLDVVVPGAYIDSAGCRKSPIAVLSTMTGGTVLIVFIPGYATIGLLALALMLLGYLLQGFSTGAELGGVSVYLAEMVTPGRKGFFTSWQFTSQQAAIVVMAGLRLALNQWLSAPTIAAWGWRVPFFVGCMTVPFIFVLYRNLKEMQEFNARRHRPSMRKVFGALLQNWGVVAAGMMLVAITATNFYLITVYAPTFGEAVLHLSTADSLLVMLCAKVSSFMRLPIDGVLSDRTGRRLLLIGVTILAIAAAYLALSLLVLMPSLINMLFTLLWLSFMYGVCNGTMVVASAEVMPVQVHMAGFSLVYSPTTVVFDDLAPVISTAITHMTDDKVVPGYQVSSAAACVLMATLTLYRRHVLTPAPAH